jgi:hypothetical protein
MNLLAPQKHSEKTSQNPTTTNGNRSIFTIFSNTKYLPYISLPQQFKLNHHHDRRREEG